MLDLTLRRGTLLLTRDPWIRTIQTGPVELIMPEGLQQVAPTGFVHHHEPSDWWIHQGEESLTGKRILFDKWSPQSFTWEGVEFWVLPEQTVLAVYVENEE